MEEVEAVCHRVAIIDHGRLLQQGTLDELLDRTRMELWVKVSEPPPDLVTRLRDCAEVQINADGTTRILISENLHTQKVVRANRLRAVLDLLENALIPLLESQRK